MPLFARSYQELMADSLEDLANNTNITKLSAGGIARALLEAMNTRLAEAYEIFDLNMARAFVSSAPGQFLELIGTLLGVEREPSFAANADADTQVIKFYVNTGTFGALNGGNDITLLQGTVISTLASNGGILYKTTETVTLNVADTDQWVGAIAVQPGEDANVGTSVLVYHDFTNYTDSDNSTLLVTNVHQIANGKNFESDANYRYRIVNKALEAEAANNTAIRLAVLSTPGVADAVLLPRYRGIGTVGVIIQSVLPTVSDSLIDAVTANVFKVQALGDLTFIRKPFETGVTMKVTVHYDQQLTEEELQEIENLLEDAIIEYINELDIGEDFFINRLAADLFAVSDHIANLGEPGIPFDEVYVWTESKLEDNRMRQKLLADYESEDDERVIVEPTVATPFTFIRSFVRR